LVADAEVLAHPLPDEPLAGDRERVVRQPAGERVAEEERGREVLDLARREEQRRLAVHGQPQEREKPRVVGEEPGRAAADVPPLVADAERRALENRERHGAGGSLLTIRAPEDCASAFTTISSTFTCRGRVSAKRMQSATWSGVIGSTPAYTAFAASSSPRKRTREKSVSTRPGSTVVRRIGRPSRSSRRA